MVFIYIITNNACKMIVEYRKRGYHQCHFKNNSFNHSAWYRVNNLTDDMAVVTIYTDGILGLKKRVCIPFFIERHIPVTVAIGRAWHEGKIEWNMK